MPLTSEEISALLLSLKVGLVATLLCLPVGIGVAWLLARRTFRGKTVVEALVTFPLVLPPIVTGYLLLVSLGGGGPVGAFLDRLGWPIAFTWRGATLASAIVGFPLLVRSARVAIEGVEPGLEDAARTLGAGRWRVFRTITLPLALPGILSGALLCFARSVGEFGATITFCGNIAGETRTLPLAIFRTVQVPGEDWAAARLVLLSLLLCFLAIGASEWLVRRGTRQRGAGRD